MATPDLTSSPSGHDRPGPARAPSLGMGGGGSSCADSTLGDRGAVAAQPLSVLVTEAVSPYPVISELPLSDGCGPHRDSELSVKILAGEMGLP